jgi:hypothetical protein
MEGWPLRAMTLATIERRSNEEIAAPLDCDGRALSEVDGEIGS